MTLIKCDEMYNLEGTYDFQGKTNHFTGHIGIDGKSFGGIIKEFGLKPSEHVISGLVEIVNGQRVIEFLKKAPDYFMIDPIIYNFIKKEPNIRYQFIKKGEGMIGEYNGLWKNVVNPEDCAYLEEGYGVRDVSGNDIWTPYTELKNKATLII